MEQGGTAGGPDGPGRLGHGEQGPQLVVHQHHGNQNGVRAQGLRQLAGGDGALAVGLEIGHLVPLALQGPAGLQHGGVLDGSGDDVPALPPAQPGRPPDGPVVALRAAGGEKELLRAAAQGPGHIGPPLLQPLGRLDARGIAGGGVAPQGGHGLHSRLDRLGPHWRGGRVIQIMCHGVSFLSQYETMPF